jgi:hypothetical protein
VAREPLRHAALDGVTQDVIRATFRGFVVADPFADFVAPPFSLEPFAPTQPAAFAPQPAAGGNLNLIAQAVGISRSAPPGSARWRGVGSGQPQGSAIGAVPPVVDEFGPFARLEGGRRRSVRPAGEHGQLAGLRPGQRQSGRTVDEFDPFAKLGPTHPPDPGTMPADDRLDRFAPLAGGQNQPVAATADPLAPFAFPEWVGGRRQDADETFDPFADLG